MMKKQSLRANERGQSLVEFAVSVTLLLTLLAGVVDSSRALFTYLALRDAVQEGSLYGSTEPLDQNDYDGDGNRTEINPRIEARVRSSSDLVSSLGGDITVQVTMLSTPCTGNGIRVTVQYDEFPLTMPFIGAIIGSQTVAISATATDTILRPVC
jgi:Flp pilus assembly protein TadG